MALFKPLTDFHRQYSFLRGNIITIDGCVGIGKSTVGEKLAKLFNENGMKAEYFTEYLNQDLLNLFLDDMKQNAYTFQLFMLNKRLELYRQAYETACKGIICIIDRSIIGDECFFLMMYKRGFITQQQYNVYYSIRHSEDRLVPNYMFYLHCDPNITLNRINKRNRPGEVSSYSLDYIKELNETHETLLNELSKNFPGQVINVDWSAEQDPGSIDPELLLKHI